LIRTIIISAMLVVAAIAGSVSAEPKKAAAAVDTTAAAKQNAAKADTVGADKKKHAAADTAAVAKQKAAKADTVGADKKKHVAADTAAAAKQKAAKADTVGADKKKHAVADTPAAAKQKAAASDAVTVIDTVVTVDTVAMADTAAAVDSMVVIYTIAGGADTSGRVDNFASYGRERKRLYSVRNDIMIVLGEISSAGLNFEAGLIDENGYLISLDIGGGVNYWGVGLNVGYSFNVSENSKHIIGVSGNFHNTELIVRVRTESGAKVSTEYGCNRGFAGIFWKVMPWETKNLDITNRFLFGYKRDSAWWDDDNAEIEYRKGFSVTYSLTVGYTLMKRSK